MRSLLLLSLSCALVFLIQMPSVTKADCTDVDFCNYNGRCMVKKPNVTTHCICDRGYITKDCLNETECCFKQDSRVLHFLLALFFQCFTGVQFFLAGETGWGVGILLLFWGGFVLCGCAVQGQGATCGCVGALAVLAALSWWFASWIILAASSEPSDWNIAPWP